MGSRGLWLRFGLLAMVGGLCEAQSLTIYTEILPPYSIQEPDGKLGGFTVEIVREIQARTGQHDPIQPVPWVRGYNEVLSRPNTVLFTMAYSVEREPLFQWVGPLKESSDVFFVRADSKLVIKNLEDARKLGLIGVVTADVRDQYLTQAGFTNLDRSLDRGIAFKKLKAGRIDALVCTPEMMTELAERGDLRPEEFRIAYTVKLVRAYIVFSKGSSESMVQVWTEALNRMKADGTFESIFRKYFSRAPRAVELGSGLPGK